MKFSNNCVLSFDYSPLKHFYRETLPAYRESKKKYQRALEEVDLAQLKYLAMKKSSVISLTSNSLTVPL